MLAIHVRCSFLLFLATLLSSFTAVADDLEVSSRSLRSAAAIVENAQATTVVDVQKQLCASPEAARFEALDNDLFLVRQVNMSAPTALAELTAIAQRVKVDVPPQGPSAAYELQTRIITKLRSDLAEARKSFRTLAVTTFTAKLARDCDDSCVEDLLHLCSVGPDRAGPPALLPEVVAPTRGLSWQAGVTSGLASFLEDRAEAELTMWVVNTLQRDLCEAGTRDWFERTCVLVRRASFHRANAPGVALAAAIRHDLRKAPATLLRRAKPESSVPVGVLERALEQLQTGDAPLGLLAGLSESQGLLDACAKRPNGISCRLVLVGRLVSLMGDVVQASSDRGPELERIAEKLNIYGQKFCIKEQDQEDPFCDRLGRLTSKQLVPVLADAYALTQKLRDWQGSTKEFDGGERPTQLLQMTLSILDGAMPLFLGDAVNTGETKSGDGAKTKSEAKVTTPSVDREWANVRTALVVMGSFSRGSFAEGFGQLAQLEEGVLASFPDEAQRKVQLPPRLFEHGTLLLNLATARNGADVEGALSAAAAPVGSWRTKRRRFTVSTTGILGGSGGIEIPTEFDARPLQQELPAHAAASAVAAVGIDVAWPLGYWSAGFFVSLLDLGQLLSLPINPRHAMRGGAEYTAQAGTELEAAQILSPGLFGRLGLGDTPLTFAMGASVAPILRQFERRDPVTRARLDDELFTVIRLQALVGVDVTILPF